jgi:hypothetical protein
VVADDGGDRRADRTFVRERNLHPLASNAAPSDVGPNPSSPMVIPATRARPSPDSAEYRIASFEVITNEWVVMSRRAMTSSIASRVLEPSSRMGHVVSASRPAHTVSGLATSTNSFGRVARDTKASVVGGPRRSDRGRSVW